MLSITIGCGAGAVTSGLPPLFIEPLLVIVLKFDLIRLRTAEGEERRRQAAYAEAHTGA
jgi:hypothetical protein